MATQPGRQRVIQGTVVSEKMDKTIVVAVAQRKKHRLYRKVVTFTRRIKAHDETNTGRLGDLVRIVECRPYSKDKQFRLLEILSRGDVADIAPATIGRDLEETTQVAPKAEVQESEATPDAVEAQP